MPTPPAILSSASEADVARACAAHRPHLTTPAEFHALREHAQAHKARAYCPYSRFRVGAAVLTSGGKLVGGANVENASYPVTTCAERVAIGRAVADGHLHEHHQAGKGGGGGGGFIRAVAVATDLPAPGSPCGMCRQCIREFCDLSTPIMMFDKDGNFSIMKLEELLPLSFGPDALGMPDPSKSQAGQA